MPLYEFVCYECGTEDDFIKSIKDRDKPENCTKCSSSKTMRRIEIPSSVGLLPGECYKFGVTTATGQKLKEEKKRFTPARKKK